MVIPVPNGGFDVYQQGTSTPIGDNRFVNVFADGVPVYDATTGAPTGEFADVPAGFVASGSNVGIKRADAYLQETPGSQGAAYIANNGGSLSQTLTGTSLQPNTTYVLSVDVLDSSYAVDGVTIGVAPTVALELTAAGSDLGGILTYVPPGEGGRSTATLTFTTGADISGLPTGPLGIVISTSGTNPNTTVTQTLFDSVSLTAVPEPAGLGIVLAAGSVGLLRRGRRPSAD